MIRGPGSLRPALALIPARAGSKGIPGKNARRVGGRSLVRLAIECAGRTGLFDRIAVTSDSPAALREARRAGVEAIRRPAALATDSSNVAGAVGHALRTLAARGFEPGAVVLLEPTCPLRTPAMVAGALESLKRAEAAVTVTRLEPRYHPAKQFVLGPRGVARPACPGARAPATRQELSPTYIRNGAAYAFRTRLFRRERSVLGRRPLALVIDEPLVNVDTPEDLALARRLWRGRRGRGLPKS